MSTEHMAQAYMKANHNHPQTKFLLQVEASWLHRLNW